MDDCEPIVGGCLCGSVRYSVAPPTKWCAHCHCSICRRAHGAAFVTWFGADSERFALQQGEDELTWHASSAEARRGFCSRCGSMLFFASSRWPDEVHVTLASADSPIDRMPQAHVYWDDHVAWFPFRDELPRLGGPTGVEPLDE